MKFHVVNALTKLTLLGAMLIVPTVVSVHAQSLQYRIKANIPFEFSVGDKKLQAGKYSFGRAREGSDDTILSVDDLAGHWKAIGASSSVQTLAIKKRPQLIFHRYGDQYFLFQVWSAGASTGRQFLKSKQESELERTYVANASSGKIHQKNLVEIVTIAGLER